MIKLNLLMQLNNPQVVEILHQNYRGWKHYIYLYKLTTVATIIITIIAIIATIFIQKKVKEKHRPKCYEKLKPVTGFLLLGIPFLMFCFHISTAPQNGRIVSDFVGGNGYLDRYSQNYDMSSNFSPYFERIPEIDKISWESLPKIRREQKQACTTKDKKKYQYYYNQRKQTNLVKPWQYDNQKYYYYKNRYYNQINRNQDNQTELRSILKVKAPKKLEI